MVTNIPDCDENTFFVAHSLGTITLLKYLEKLNNIQKVGGIILVSGFANSLPICNQIEEFKQLEEFTKDEIDFEHIKKVTQYRSIITSGNDPIVPAELSSNLAEQLGSEYHLINEGGHFLESDGFLELPIVYEELNNMMRKGVVEMKILEPITVKNIEFKNRVVMAPMVAFGFSNGDGTMGLELIQHYLKRAGTGIGLMISQAHSITKDRTIDGVGVYSDSQIDDLRTIAAACHDNNTSFFVQLAYPDYDYKNGDTIDGLLINDLEEMEREFISSAQRCFQAGCDGIELHGAHGFFLNMFSSSLANKRNDQYGGDLEGRLRLVANIVKGIKKFSNDNFIISYRMGWNDSIEDDIEMAQMLEKLGVEMLHVSTGIPSDRTISVPDGFPCNDVVYTGTQIKAHVSIPVIAVNDIETVRTGNYLIENNLSDFVAYGKPFLADESFMVKSRDNIDYKPCLKCKNCQWSTNGKRCPVQIKLKKYN